MHEKHFIQNEKRQKIAVTIHLPLEGGSGTTKYPVIIIAHGLKGYKEEAHYVDLTERLNLRGFVAVGFDMRGFGESEGSLEEDYRFTNYIKDFDAVLSFIKGLPYINADKIGVCGVSMGGMLAIVAAVRYPELFTVVSISSPDKATVHDDLSEKMEEWKATGHLALPGSLKGTVRIPYAFAEDIQQYDMKEYVKEVRVPLLFIAGTKDTNVPSHLTKSIFDVANEPKYFIEVDGADHFYKKDPSTTAYINDKVVEFFLRYL